MTPVHIARKGMEQGLRELRLAPDQLAGRRLAVQWRRRAGQPKDGPRVAILTPRSWASHVQQEAVMAHALALRGAAVTILTCGGGLEICDRSNVHESPPMPCRTCSGYTDAAVDAHGLRRLPLFDETYRPSSWPELDQLSSSELLDVEYKGLPLGDIIDIPSQWFLLSTSAEEPLVPMTRRRFLRSARAIADACSARFDQLQPDHVVLLNGAFLFEAVALALARQRNVDIVSYERGFRHGTLFFTRGEPAIEYDIGSTADKALRRPLSRTEEERLDELLDQRRAGRTHFIPLSPHGEPRVSAADDGTTFVLFTNLTWDSAVIHREIAFSGVRQWMSAAISAIAGRPRDRLIIRVHPAEIKLPGKETREPFVPLIDELFPELPPNVVVLGPGDPTSSYALMDLADVGLVYTSTTGLEMALAGKPVIVAAQTHYRGRGFTFDAEDPVSFEHLVATVGTDPAAHEPDVVAARRYANAFFFNRLLPAWFVSEPIPGLARVEVDSLSQLAPGADGAIDAICDGILDEGSFEFVPPEERTRGPQHGRLK